MITAHRPLPRGCFAFSALFLPDTGSDSRANSGMSLFAMWGGFWIGYGILWRLDTTGTIALPPFTVGFGPLGQVFIYMAVITWTTAFAALGRSPLRFLSTGDEGGARARPAGLPRRTPGGRLLREGAAWGSTGNRAARHPWKPSFTRVARGNPSRRGVDVWLARRVVECFAEHDAFWGNRELADVGVVSACAGLEHGQGAVDLGIATHELEQDDVVGEVGNAVFGEVRDAEQPWCFLAHHDADLLRCAALQQ